MESTQRPVTTFRKKLLIDEKNKKKLPFDETGSLMKNRKLVCIALSIINLHDAHF